MKKVILIDGNNILFRSYYATAYTGNTMKNSKGVPTNALYGLINMLNKIINEENPEYVMLALDKGKTFRHEKYVDYKGGRSETPDELKMQFPLAKKLIEAMGITYYEVDNYEADDIIGTFAKAVDENDDYIATIISSDKDLLQLISDDVEVKLLKTHDYIRMTKEEFINTYGIEPIRMIDLKALMGDSSDNIPGVKGIGEKTALNLLHEYNDLDNLYANIDKIKGKTKEKLENDKEQAYVSKDLATIYKDVPMEVDFEAIRYKGIDAIKYVELLEEFEFYSILKKLDIKKDTLNNHVTNYDVEIIKTKEELDSFSLKENSAIYVEILGENYHKDKALGVSVYDGVKGFYIPFDIFVTKKDFFKNTNNILSYDLKKLLVLCSYNQMDLPKSDFDLMVASYLLNKNVKNDIAYVANAIDENLDFYETIYGSGAKLKENTLEVMAKDGVKKAKFIFDIKEEIIKEINDYEASLLFNQIEMPLIYVLADMEVTGIKVNRDFLEEMSEELKKQMNELAREIYLEAGMEFNIMSPKQLGEVLFVHMNLPYPKRQKGDSYSTNKEVLDKLVSVNPIVAKILEYRTLAKLYTNYTVGLINEIANDGRIHTTFNQTLTRTGRLSSEAPNLQNIPIRLEYGRLIRKAFVPGEDSLLLSSDYSQIELRIFAHMANATNLIEAFKEGKDIHSQTASDIFGVPIEEVTKDMRRTAKAVNFGILYGISSFGLSEDLGIDVASAKKFIDDYLKAYPGIKDHMNEVIEKAHKLGYVKTIMNRKRTIDELSNKNYMIRSQGERMALNTPIQGSSADILKKAMVEIFQELNKRQLKTKMLIQVHDELVFEVPTEEFEEVKEIVRTKMEDVYTLTVPLKVDIEYGKDWYEAK